MEDREQADKCLVLLIGQQLELQLLLAAAHWLRQCVRLLLIHVENKLMTKNRQLK